MRNRSPFGEVMEGIGDDEADFVMDPGLWPGAWVHAGQTGPEVFKLF